MTHDPLCPVLSPQRWDHYPFSCCCELIAKVREDMLAKCITAIGDYAAERLVKTRDPNMSEDITAALRVAAKRLRALQEKP